MTNASCTRVSGQGGTGVALKRWRRSASRLAIAGGAAALLLSGCSATASLPFAGRYGVTVSSGLPASPVPATAAATAATLTPQTSSALEQSFVQVVKTVSPSVVQIESATGLGSGVVFDRKGDIVTNAHVLQGQQTFNVTTANGGQSKGRLVGIDPSHDLAVVRIASTTLTPATFGDSNKLQVGDLVLALGSPYGLQGSVTQGLVSAMHRDIPESRQVTLQGLIQTSAPINPGNSGGALVDLSGEVVGIPTLGASGGAGIGFAIPSSDVVRVANQLIGQG
ncbi:MAG: trypsin-like peptidase domain-containing protein [Candidatus Dormibacteraeota bacterium]|nr:trypsin-like peptidase domain-containing protein [Candidatus Dormibacteraeota bacterium]